MKKDLTRWNRAGLKRIRYINGNAATFLEDIRSNLLENEKFKKWEELKAVYDTKDSETDSNHAVEEYEHLQSQKGSMGLEIIRSFARASHVLTEHIDAYANESFLGTATQWDNIRRLVGMIDYHPAPPASAETYLAVQVKNGKDGVIPKGFQVKHNPENAPPVIFETFEDTLVHSELNELWTQPQKTEAFFMDIVLDRFENTLVHSELNELRLEGWDQPKKTEAPFIDIVLDRIVNGLHAGDPVVFESKDDWKWMRASIISKIVLDPLTKTTKLSFKHKVSFDGIKISSIVVRLMPMVKSEILSYTSRSQKNEFIQLVDLPYPDKLKKGTVVFIGKEESGGQYHKVHSVDGKRIILIDPIDYPKEECWVGEAIPVPLKEVDKPEDDSSRKISHNFSQWHGKIISVASSNDLKTISACVDSKAEAPYTVFTCPDTANSFKDVGKIYIPPESLQWKVDNLFDVSQSFNITAIRQLTNDICVLCCGDNLMSGWIKSANYDQAQSQKQVEVNWCPPESKNLEFYASQTRFFANFKENARIVGWSNNEETSLGAFVLSNSNLSTSARKMLVKDRLIIVESNGTSSPGFPLVTQIDSYDHNVLTLKDCLPSAPKIKDILIRANVVRAGHGERMPEKILGSGDASKNSQEFLFEVSEVSFVPDSSFQSGVRADISITAGGEKWAQVSSFTDSRSSDPHFVIRMTENGFLRIIFGDGVNGRRLPTGENNIRISCRTGTGLRGNIDSGRLVEPMNSLPFVEAILHPVPCEGGNDMDGVSSLKSNAARSVMCMDRAVSAYDIASIVASHSSVWDAKAYEQINGTDSTRYVEVFVLPAQGRPLGKLSEELRDFIISKSIAGTKIEVIDCVQSTFKMNITLHIDTRRFYPESVKESVKQILLAAFSLRQMKIGKSVYKSDVLGLVESVTGVDHSECIFNHNKTEAKVTAEAYQICHLLEDNLVIEYKEAEI